jgi:acyl carrier protein
MNLAAPRSKSLTASILLHTQCKSKISRLPQRFYAVCESNGRHSTYVLFRLIEMGYKVDTFTFDNGFISKTAFENIHRVTSRFGIRHVNCTMNNMKTVFAESLGNSSTVCNGCFRALTMLSTKIAHDRGINVIVTGLSRGQIFDTKLKMLYDNGIIDPDEIDRRLMVHRKIFYSQEDTVSNTLKLPNDESNFHIHYADFFRYSNISAPAIRKYLATVDKTWVTPKDTGLCSTNCMINNVGIYVHKAERGYHNYAEPLSWDIRLGVTQREDAMRELHEDIDLRQVENILNYLNYKPKIKDVIEDVAVSMREGPDGGAYLIGWFVSSSAINTTHLRQYLATRLSDYMVPRYLIRVNAIPSTHNGKIDYEKLPVPETEASTTLREGNSGDDELSTLTGLWEEVLGVSKIGMDDNFFDLGGQSLAATILVGLIEQQLKQEISVIDAVRNPTIRKMATLLGITTGNGKNANSLSARTASMS